MDEYMLKWDSDLYFSNCSKQFLLFIYSILIAEYDRDIVSC